MMHALKKCCERITQMMSEKKKKAYNKLAKKYSSLDHSMSEFNSPADRAEKIIPNKFIEEEGRKVFIKPDIDEQTAAHSQPMNLYLSKCRKGQYYILNNFQNAYIDECTDTMIFIGPCHSTIFIRNSTNLRIRIISQQLRIQNCEEIQIEGIVGVKPVLEESKAITFAALSVQIYDDLLWQIERCKINIFDNQIYQCYDFTPKKHPNFHNEQKIEEMDKSWGRKIKESGLIWLEEQIYLPHRLALKNSMVKKVYTEKYLSSMKEIAILCISPQLNLKDILLYLTKNKIELVGEFDSEVAQSVLSLSEKQKCRFILATIPQSLNKMQGVEIISDSKAIAQIISEQKL